MEVSIKAAPPNIVYLLDDSGSMDWEFMTQENDGLFSGMYYVFKDSDYENNVDHNYGTGHSIFNAHKERYWKSQWSGYNKLYYNPRNIYKPWPNMQDADTAHPRSNPAHSSPTFNLADVFVDLGETDSDDYGDTWQEAAQIACGTVTAELEEAGDHDVFKIELTSDGNLTVFNTGCSDNMARILDSSGNEYRADEYADSWTKPYSDGNNYKDDCGKESWCDSTLACHSDKDRNFYIKLNDVPAGTYYIDIRGWSSSTGTYQTNIDFTGSCSTPPPPPAPTNVKIYNAHYFVWNDTNFNGNIDANETYLVNFEDTNGDGLLDARKYYKFTASDDVVDLGELVPVNDSDIPDSIKAYNRDSDGNPTTPMTFSEELQNFANWFSYYRRRELTAKAAVAFSIDQIGWAQIGFYTINDDDNRQCVLPINVMVNGVLKNDKNTLLNKLYGIDSSGYTPLRRGLLNVGKYFQKNTSSAIRCDSPYWSEEDGGACQQSFCIAMTDGYWNGWSPQVGNQDGNQGVPYADSWSDTLADVAMKYYKTDLCPALDNVVPVNSCDPADWQHMVTYTVSFGVRGTLSPLDADGDGKEDDPCFLDANTPAPSWPSPYNGDLEKIDDLWHAAVNGHGLFFSAANPKELVDALNSITSNLLSRLSSGASVAVNGEKLTESSVVYQTIYKPDQWIGNLIAYPMNADTGEVMREEGDILWKAAEKLEGQDWDTGRNIITSNGNVGVPFRYNNLSASQQDDLENNPDLVDYLRGKEINGMRLRPQKLGDIVHSAPVINNGAIFVGGNDGMLHVFDKDDGHEIFAFIPTMVFPKLKELAKTNYSHKFFVDLTPTVVNTGSKTILVGGLGAGGKGYFALDVTNPRSVTENSAATVFMWEYFNDNDIGLSYSRPAIVRSYSNSHPWVVIFGNGYNSENGSAVLFILDAFSGTLVKKIDTGVTGCNGLSTPAVADINGDFIGDYVYAGDIKGNMWKFDITSHDESDWHISYAEGGSPKPLFTAEGQPITAKPDVMKHCKNNGYMVLFGTGRFLNSADKTDTSQQTLYGIWDYGDPDDPSEYVGSFNATTGELTTNLEHVRLVKQVVVRNGGEGYLSANATNWQMTDDNDTNQWPNPKGTQENPATIGWYINLGALGEGERMVRDVMIRGGNGIFITLAPDNSPCSGGGKSGLYEIDACSGGKTSQSVFNPDVEVQEHQDFPNVIFKDIIMYPPKIQQLPPNFGSGSGSSYGPRQEQKLISTSQGTIIQQRERAAWRGYSYWKEW